MLRAHVKQRASAEPRAPVSRRLLVRWMTLVGLAVMAAAASGIGVRATYGAPVTADEPQYLLSAISLAEDGDLNIADERAEGRYRTFHPPDLPPQDAAQPDGSRLSPHNPLLPVLLALPVKLGGWVGAKLAMAAMAGVLAAALIWVSVRRLAVPPGVAACVVALFGLSAPLAVYGSQIYPELPAALAVTLALTAATGPLGRRGTLLAVAAVVALPWLSVKYSPVALVLAAVLVGRMALRRRVKGLASTALVVAALGLAGVTYAWFHLATYGGITPYAAGSHFADDQAEVMGTAPDLLGRSRRLVGLLTDQSFGLAAWSPIHLLAVPALAAVGTQDAAWFRLRRRAGPDPAPSARRPHPGDAKPGEASWIGAALVATVAAGWLTATFPALTMHGWWWPGRQVVVVLPGVILAVAAWAGRSWAGRRLWVVGTGLIGVATFGVVVVEGWLTRLTWVVDFTTTVAPWYRLWRNLLPDYTRPGTLDWALHGGWLAFMVWLGLTSARLSRSSNHAEGLDFGNPPTAPASLVERGRP
ncbi:MAG: hypothetical protein ACT4OS_00515 [Acidimicrobiales bacterium]